MGKIRTLILGAAGREALGQAYLRDSVLALAHEGRKSKADRRYEQAKRYIHIDLSPDPDYDSWETSFLIVIIEQ